MAGMGEHKFFLDGAFNGGPLGELAQWCDLISALYILGHDLIIGFQVEDIPWWENAFNYSNYKLLFLYDNLEEVGLEPNEVAKMASLTTVNTVINKCISARLVRPSY